MAMTKEARREQDREHKRKYYQAHPEQSRERSRRWYAANRRKAGGYQHNDLTSQMFGRLRALNPLKERRHGGFQWLCLCECGNEVVVRARDLRSGATRSCGCLQRESAKAMGTANGEAKRTHGHTVGHDTVSGVSRTYTTLGSMKQRCNNPNRDSYPWYGGRGITVCDEWNAPHGFEVFLADMGERPEGTTIDRIDPDGNYEPSNCRWSTPKQQCNNRRPRSLVAA